VEKGEKGTGGGENRHDFVHVVAEVVKKRHLVQLAVFQNQRDVLDGQHGEVALRQKATSVSMEWTLACQKINQPRSGCPMSMARISRAEL
jgi:hypothetical protein